MTTLPTTKRVFRSSAPRPKRMQLRMVPMIDVVFLLLVFFLVTANFRSREGFLPAELPRQLVHAQQTELEPLEIRLASQDGRQCLIEIGTQEPFLVANDSEGFALFTQRLADILAVQGRRNDDPVKLIPTPETKWEHLVKAYDAIYQQNITNVIFTIVH